MSDRGVSVELSEEEAARQLAEAHSALARQVQKGKKQFAYAIKLAQDRLAYAQEELAVVEAQWKALQAHQEHPEGAYHATNMELLRHGYASMKRIAEILLAANQHNLAIVESEAMPANPVYRIPEQELDYLEARAYMLVSFGMFAWIQMAEGIDALLRAAALPGTLQCDTPEDEAARQAMADQIKQAALTDRNLAITLGQWGNELAEAFRLLSWGKGLLGRVGTMSPEEKRTALEAGDWAKLNARVTAMGALPGKVKAYAALAGLFGELPDFKLPYDAVEVQDQPEAAGTDRLQRTGSQPLKRTGPDPNSQFKRSGDSNWGA